MATIETPVVLYRENVLPTWIDDNGHMTAAAFLAAFTTAGGAFRFPGCTPPVPAKSIVIRDPVISSATSTGVPSSI